MIKVGMEGAAIVVFVVVEEEPSERIREDISVAAAEIIADFPEAEMIVERFEVSVLGLAKENILEHGWVYERAETRGS
jgi:hypothetical protein